MTFRIGTDVEVNGNKEGVVKYYDKELNMYEVRLMDGSRYVGAVVVPEEEIKLSVLECYWCRDKDAVLGGLCKNCYGLGA